MCTNSTHKDLRTPKTNLPERNIEIASYAPCLRIETQNKVEQNNN